MITSLITLCLRSSNYPVMIAVRTQEKVQKIQYVQFKVSTASSLAYRVENKVSQKMQNGTAQCSSTSRPALWQTEFNRNLLC